MADKNVKSYCQSLGAALACRRRVGRAVFFCVVTELVCEFETFLQKLCYAALPIWNIVTNNKLAVYTHVVDRIKLGPC